MIWQNRVMMPAKIAATTMVRTSRLMMWVSSWPSTASSSSRSRLCSRPRVTVTLKRPSCRPLAKAFMPSVSMTRSVGVFRPREMQRFSSRL